MLTRQTLFGSRDATRDGPRDVARSSRLPESAMQSRPNPSQPVSPAAEAVRISGLRNVADASSTAAAPPAEAVTSAEIPPAPRPQPQPPQSDRAKPEAQDRAAERTASADARMVVGPNIRMKGVEINDCDTLIVEGTIEATMDARHLEIAPTGAYTGRASVDSAEIHGLFTGDLTVRRRLVVHATGKIGGTLRYGKMIVEEGGELSGDVKSICAEVTPLAEARASADAIPARR